MFTPLNEVLLLRDVGLERFRMMETAAQHEIELKVPQGSAANVVPPFASTIYVGCGNRV
jgi:hypothetical protein